MRATLVVVLLALLATACAPLPQPYMRFVSNNGASQDQYMKDTLAACLARGYYRVADTTNLDDFKRPGKCCVPAGTQIQCSPR
jgi:hypothetical protein